MDNIPPTPPPIYARDIKKAPLSYSQESLWFLQQLDPASNAYNSNFNILITGGVEHQVLERSVNDLIERHASLRTLYPNRGGNPVQEVLAFEPAAIPLVDLSGQSHDSALEELDHHLDEMGREPFDLLNGPLSRIVHFRISKTEDVLFFGTHHINSDAWSRDVFKRELIKIYTANLEGKPAKLAENTIQYTDYAAWQKEWLTGDNLKAYTDHWRTILAGDLPVLDLPTDRPHPLVQTYNGVRYSFAFPPTLANQIKAFCVKQRLTPFHFYMAAFAVLLLRYTGQEDLIMGCPFANRPQPEFEDMIGLFVNTLPIRINLTDNPSVMALVERVREIMLDAFTWQAAPFEIIVSELDPARDLARTPIFQVAINMRNIPPRQEIQDSAISAEFMRRENVPAPFDISLDFDETSTGMTPSFHYNADLFDEKTVIRMAGHYQNILNGFLTSPENPVSEIEMLGQAEKKHILFDLNNTKADFSQACIHDLVKVQAAKSPDAVAVRCNDQALTYMQIERQSNQLAHFLQSKGVRPGARVAVFFPRSVLSIVSLVAILKTGAAYLSIDLTFPAARIAELISDSNPVAVITDAAVSEKLPAGNNLILMDSDYKSILTFTEEPLASRIDNSSSAYIIYTSGSTGKPKGSLNHHKGVVNFLEYMEKTYHLGSDDSILQLTPFGFDLSVFEIFETLATGGTIHMMDDSQMRDPEFINREIEKYKVTCISAVPTMFRALCEARLEHPELIHRPKIAFPAGEALLRSDVELIRKAYGEQVQVVNLYGPSECSIIQSTYLVPGDLTPDTQIISIGTPVSNTRSYVLDKYFKPVSLGTPGELYVAGICVGGGYLNRPELTAEKFLPDPFHIGEKMYRTGDLARRTQDGLTHFLGRLDDQVKIRGYRVELGEIEAVIATYFGVKEAAVKLWKTSGNSTIAAYITLLPEAEADIETKLHSHLNDHLPFYMLPSTIQVLDKFPYTATGKVNKRALPEPGDKKGDNQYIAPRNDLEKKLVSIWEKVLDARMIGVTDNFFELGGHSLMAVRMFTMIQKELGKSIPLVALFKDATIQSLARYIEQDSAGNVEGVVPIEEIGNRPPVFILPAGLQLEKLAHELGRGTPIYALYPVEGGKKVYRGSIQETAGIYYRNLVDFKDKGPYHLLGHSADGWYALELARLLRAKGYEVGMVGLIDTYPPGSPLKVPFADRIQPHLEELKKRSIFEQVKYLLRSVKKESSRRMRASADARIIRAHKLEAKAMEGRRILLKTYDPKPYEGNVVVFSVTRRPARVNNDLMQSWSKWITGRLEIIQVEGDHMSILEEPQVAGLAEQINRVLERIAHE